MSGNDPMAEIRASFFIECEELLESLQDGLVSLDGGDNDAETINVCFRAVHSIKGGAGAFGLDDLVKFAHRYETVMDCIRSGTLTPDRDAMTLFFRAADILSDLVRAAQEGSEIDADMVEGCLVELEALVDGVDEGEEEAEVEFAPMTLSLDMDIDLEEPESPAVAPRWQIDFAPEKELFPSGNEPRHLIQGLTELGDIEITCDTQRVPDLTELDPAEAYLSWSIVIETDQMESDLREAFDFVEGLCKLTVTPLPGADLPATDLPAGEAATPAPFDEPSPHIPPPPPTIDDAAPDGPAPAAPPPQAQRVAPEQDAPAARSAPAPAPAKPAAGASPQGGGNPTVRVDLDRIDRLVNLVGELVINQAMLSQSVTEAGLNTNSKVTSGLEEFMQLTRDIQDSVMMIRAQPVKSLFQRMSRIVREASATIGKRVNFVTIGEQAEVDKTVIERLADPLTHMIRNAVDHGLEDGATRVAAGKPEEGTVTLSAAHKSGRVIIEVSDDGGGINRPRVKQIAEDKGLIPSGLELSDSEIDGLLFLPGFSTAKEISSLSGRGVGMDVVRSAIQALGGRVTIQSTPGKGTTFSISLPLTLAVLDGMVVKVADETLVVPLGAILETVSLTREDVRTVGASSPVIHIRGTFVPILDLGAELGYRAPVGDYEGSVVLLIAQEDGTQAALLVDRIEEQRQVVIKGLQEAYGRIPGIAAATILGDGKIALILDPVDLMTNALGRSKPGTKPLELAG